MENNNIYVKAVINILRFKSKFWFARDPCIHIYRMYHKIIHSWNYSIHLKYYLYIISKKRRRSHRKCLASESWKRIQTMVLWYMMNCYVKTDWLFPIDDCTSQFIRYAITFILLLLRWLIKLCRKYSVLV